MTFLSVWTDEYSSLRWMIKTADPNVFLLLNFCSGQMKTELLHLLTISFIAKPIIP
jgi:hypothetical protein